MRKFVIKSSNSGISLITLIITIIVFIILAGIIIYSQLGTGDNAMYAKFVQEFEEVRKSVETVRLSDAKSDIKNIDKSFKMVEVAGDIPYSFLSIPGDKKQAYLVDLSVIEADALLSGRDYKKFQSGNQVVTFGVDDVYVYDSTGRLFYAKGFLKDGKLQYEVEEEVISIVSVEQVKEDSNKTTVIIEIDSENEVKKVTVGNKEAIKNDATGKYEVENIENGKYDIFAEDIEGNTTKETIIVSPSSSTGSAPTVSVEVTNGTLTEGVWIITNENVAHLKLSSDSAHTLYISNENATPTTWLAYAEEIDRYYDNPPSGEVSLFVWVKDEEGLISSPYELKLKMVSDKTQKTYEPTTINEGIITFAVEPSEEWAKSKNLTIHFPAGMQSDGYTSSYSISNGLGSSDKIVYQQDVTIPITKNETKVNAKVVYKTIFQSKDITSNSITVDKIDTLAPRMTINAADNATISGTALDEESGLKAYAVTSEYYNVKTVLPEQIGNWQSFGSAGTSETGYYGTATKSGTWYVYVLDNVNNITMKSVKVSIKDTAKPTISASTYRRENEYAIITTTAQDEESGIVAYGIVKGIEGKVPDVWTEFANVDTISFEHKVYPESDYEMGQNETYYIWVKDGDGNVQSRKVEVTYNVSPELNDPEDVRALEGQEAHFATSIKKVGDPNKYEYNWYVSRNGGVSWSAIPGATNSIYTIKNVTMSDNNNVYKCIVEHARGQIETKSAKLEVYGISTSKPDVEVTPDRTAVLGGVIINNGESVAHNATLSLKIIAVNAEEVYISENGTKPEDAEWIKYSDEMTYTLQDTSEGEKTLTIWVRNVDGVEYNKAVATRIRLSNS